MPTTTEILVCPLTPGSDIGSDSNEASHILKEVGATLRNTDGVQQIQFGMQVEKPDVFQLLVHWDSVDHHKTFMATEEYKPFLNRFLTIVGGELQMMHAKLEPSGELTKALSAPVTEIATFYFGSDGAPEGYVEGVGKFKEIMEKEKSDGFIAAAVGLTVEDNVKSPAKKDVEGKAAVLVIGWESVEKHMQFRETATFKDNLHYLRNGVKDVEMHHVALMNFVE
ncbi:hypothetical protein BST61_g2420 [Cercospora zeina]